MLFGISLLAGLASTALFMGHRLAVETWRIVFLLALALLTITSTILIPSLLLPNITSPHPEFLSDDLQDEWSELRRRMISRPHILLIGASISALVYVRCIFYYGKLTNAIWFGWMSVGVAAILALLVFAFARRTDWFNRFYRTPTGVMLTAFAGFVAALILGISMTEQVPPAPDDQLPVAEQHVDYGYAGSRAYSITRQYLNDGPVPEISMPDCDDTCAYLFLAIVFVLLTAVLSAGAALIPHMWVLSCLVLLTLIAVLDLHDIRHDRNLRLQYGGVARFVRPGS